MNLRLVATPPPPLQLNTHPDVFVERFDRVAGIESGRFWNMWLSCPFEVRPNLAPDHLLAQGFCWRVEFRAIDDGTNRVFTGTAGTRGAATTALTNAITKCIADVCEARVRWMRRWDRAQLLSIRDGVPCAG